jgi:hypothetical protein
MLPHAGHPAAIDHSSRWRRYSFVLAACLAIMAGIAVPVAQQYFSSGHQQPTAATTARTESSAAARTAAMPLVTVGTSLQDSSATFPSSTRTFYCKADLPQVPYTMPLTFKWQSMPRGEDVFTFTGTYATPLRYTYLEGPEAPGQYRCQVFAPENGVPHLMGSASFSVR